MFKKVVLKNGLTMVFFNDNNKNRTAAIVYTFVGGFDNHFIYDGIEYNQVRGIAHFLEHYLMEKSIYGNVEEIFSNDYINTNGVTTPARTYYYISTVHDFKENYIKLLNVVNNPKFDENAIDDIKKPILAEINRAFDRPDYEYNKFIDECVYKRRRFNINLGETEDINNMSIDDIKLFHEAFYTPSNQLIMISGNFDEQEIIDITEKEYESFKRDYKEVIKDNCTEDDTFIKDSGTFVDSTKQEVFDLVYKIDVSNYDSFDKYKLSYYIYYFLLHNFSERSESFKELRDKGLSMYTIGTDSFFIDKKILAVWLYGTSEKQDEVREIAERYLKEKKTTEESFEEYKNNVLLSLINKNESIHSMRGEYEDNFFEYGYDNYDNIDIIKSLNYQECLEMINKIDFINCCYIKRIKGE